MQIESIENHLFSTVVNPGLKTIISRFDIECEKDGNLMINSLRRFLGDDLELCERCSKLSDMAKPFYEAGSKIMRADKDFMKTRFLDPVYGDTWLKGFALHACTKCSGNSGQERT